MIDLHCHSTASDGSMTPRELLFHAREKGLNAISLTDHDTVDGLAEAQLTADELGIRFIPGIEIEVAWDGPGVFHLLGLGINNYQEKFIDLIPHIMSLRARRNNAIMQKMSDHGIIATINDIAALADGKVITRPHFADYLISIGTVRDRKQAFEQFLTPGKPFYEPYPGMQLIDAVHSIHAAGGKAIVAHPLSLHVSWTRQESLMAEWKTLGVDGIEAWHPTASWRDAQRFMTLASAAGLGISGGSDFHGKHRPDRILGKTLEERHSIDDSFLTIFDE